jgi:hypothetical protein
LTVTDTNKTGESRDEEIRQEILRLQLNWLSHREIIDTLVTKGYDRETTQRIVKQMANQLTVQTDITSPLILLIVALLMVLWAVTPTPNASNEFNTAKLFIYAIGMIALIASVGTLIYKLYDRIPIMRDALEPILLRRRVSQADIAALDSQYLADQIDDFEYEQKLIALLGKQRGSRHFRFMRNRKHFGLE